MLSHRISSLFLLLLFLACQLEAFGAGSKVKCWVLTQDTPHTGSWEVFISGSGLAALNKKMGCTLVSKAPQWNIVIYNDKTKVYYLSPISDWKGVSSLGALSGKNAGKNGGKNSLKNKESVIRQAISEKKPKKIADGKILGHKASQYLTDNLAGSGLKKVEIWVANDMQPPEALKKLFTQLYQVKISYMGGMPLKVSYIDENGKRTPVINTTKVESRELPVTSFTYPSSYKRVDSELAVLMDEKGREAMASIMDDVGDAEEESSSADSRPGKRSLAKRGGEPAGRDKTDLFDDESDPETGSNSATKADADEGDWGKAISDWFTGILKALGLWKDEESDSEN